MGSALPKGMKKGSEVLDSTVPMFKGSGVQGFRVQGSGFNVQRFNIRIFGLNWFDWFH
jgi:hypothetical protein